MAFPNVEIAEANLFSNNPVLITESLSGYEQRSVVATQKFELFARFQNLSDAERRLLQSFIQTQQGPLSSFEIELPGDLGNSSAGFSGTITTSANGLVGTTSVSVTSTPSTAILKAGDFIRFTGKNKMYTVTADVTTNVSGVATLNFLPGLLTTVASGTVVLHRDVKLNARLKNISSQLNLTQTLFTNLTLEMVEVF